MSKVNKQLLFLTKTDHHSSMPHKSLLSTLLFIVFIFSNVRAQDTYPTPSDVPNPKNSGSGYITDPAGILDDTSFSRINNLLAELENNSTAQIAVVLLPSIGDENPKDFATRLFQLWGIGQADKDNGLLVFSVMDQRRTEFETGYGLEAVLPDIICYRIGMQYLVPYFKEEAYGEGILAALMQFKIVLENPETLEEIRSESRPENNKPLIVVGIYAAINILFHLFAIIWVISQLSSKQDLYNKYQGIRKIYSIFFLFFFPLPYGLMWLYLRYQLKRLRNTKRFSKLSGKPMVKLSEDEEDRFLEKGQVTEEELGSVDYDVWIAESDPEDILILRYEKRWSSFQKCPKCGYRTYQLVQTRVIRAATHTRAGKKQLTYNCKNCNYINHVTATIPKKSSGSGGGFSGSGGGGSWGGGSSGGGGAGVSW